MGSARRTTRTTRIAGRGAGPRRRGRITAGVVLAVVVATVSLPALPSAAAVPAAAPGVEQRIDLAVLGRGNPRFVDAAYKDLLGRRSDTAGRNYWLGKLSSQALTRTGCTLAMARSNEWLGKVVVRQFLTVLARPPTTSEKSTWVTKLKGGTTVPVFASSLYGGATFYAAAGSTPSAFAEALYQHVVARAPSGSETSSVVHRISVGTSRSTIAKELFLSIEANGFRVDALYLVLLKRMPDAGGRAYWANRLRTVDDVALAGLLAGSSEYYNQAQKRQLDGSITKAPTTFIAGASTITGASALGSGWVLTFAAGTLPSGTLHVVVAPGGAVPGGWLGHITSSTNNPDGSISVATEPAPIDAAFPDADITGIFDALNAQTTVAHAAVAERSTNAAACQGLALNPTITVTQSTQVDTAFQWHFGGTKRVKFVVKESATVEGSLLLGGSVTCTLELGAALPSLPLQLGPVQIQLGLQPVARITASGGITLSAKAGVSCSVGGEYLDGTVTNLSTCAPVTATAGLEPEAIEGSVQVAFGLELSAALYGRVGVSGFVGPSITVTVTPLADPWCKATMGIETSLSLFVDYFISQASIEVAGKVFGEIPIHECTGSPPITDPCAGPDYPIGAYECTWQGTIEAATDSSAASEDFSQHSHDVVTITVDPTDQTNFYNGDGWVIRTGYDWTWTHHFDETAHAFDDTAHAPCVDHILEDWTLSGHKTSTEGVEFSYGQDDNDPTHYLIHPLLTDTHQQVSTHRWGTGPVECSPTYPYDGTTEANGVAIYSGDALPDGASSAALNGSVSPPDTNGAEILTYHLHRYLPTGVLG